MWQPSQDNLCEMRQQQQSSSNWAKQSWNSLPYSEYTRGTHSNRLTTLQRALQTSARYKPSKEHNELPWSGQHHGMASTVSGTTAALCSRVYTYSKRFVACTSATATRRNMCMNKPRCAHDYGLWGADVVWAAPTTSNAFICG
jgi:hypothetical protein